MTATKQSRQVAREKLTTLAQAYMVGSGKPCQAVYSYQKAKLVGVTPCLVIASYDTEPGDADNDNSEKQRFTAHSFTRYEVIGTGSVNSPEYTEQDSENDMDTMSKQFRELCDAYSDRSAEVAPEWLYMLVGRSEIDSYTDLEGNEFRHEAFPITMIVPNAG